MTSVRQGIAVRIALAVWILAPGLAHARGRICGVVVQVSCAGIAGARVMTLLVQPGTSAFVDAPNDETAGPLRARAAPLLFDRACVRGQVTAAEMLDTPAIFVPDAADDIVSDGPGPSDWPRTNVYTSCDKGVTPPTIKTQQKPKYVNSARLSGSEGVAMMQAIVGTDGRIEQVRLLKSVDAKHGLDDEAVQTVKQWTFNPATLNGTPVRMAVALDIKFYLYKKY
jgi:TonB family protein